MNTPEQIKAHTELLKVLISRILDASGDLPKATLETFSLASLLSLLFLIKGETGILGEYYSTHRALVELTGRELYWKWPEKTTAQPGLALTVN